jgi:hypothetical protein
VTGIGAPLPGSRTAPRANCMRRMQRRCVDSGSIPCIRVGRDRRGVCHRSAICGAERDAQPLATQRCTCAGCRQPLCRIDDSLRFWGLLCSNRSRCEVALWIPGRRITITLCHYAVFALRRSGWSGSRTRFAPCTGRVGESPSRRVFFFSVDPCFDSRRRPVSGPLCSPAAAPVVQSVRSRRPDRRFPIRQSDRRAFCGSTASARRTGTMRAAHAVAANSTSTAA